MGVRNGDGEAQQRGCCVRNVSAMDMGTRSLSSYQYSWSYAVNRGLSTSSLLNSIGAPDSRKNDFVMVMCKTTPMLASKVCISMS